jgi:hypothetical protein
MATGTVVVFPGITKLDIPAERVLEAAKLAELTDIVIVGYDKDENEWFASSIADGGTVLWLMERLKKQLLE